MKFELVELGSLLGSTKAMKTLQFDPTTQVVGKM
jgi:hypothetical protein